MLYLVALAEGFKVGSLSGRAFIRGVSGKMHEDGVLVVDELTAALSTAHPMPSLASTGEAVFSGRGGAWSGKRTLDVVLSLLLLVVAAPLFLILAIVIKLTSSGPVFFRQWRVGQGGEEFRMLKFRTMRPDSEERLRSDPTLHELFVLGSHKIPCRLDPRVTAVGRVLRRLSLDELPQLLNVVSGHMSLVGPRPVERSQLVRDYDGYESAYVALRPGLTGLWQVSGRSKVQFPERAQMDSRYVHTSGPWVDIKILLRTPVAVVTGSGAD